MNSAGEVFHKVCPWAYHPHSLATHLCKFTKKKTKPNKTKSKGAVYPIILIVTEDV